MPSLQERIEFLTGEMKKAIREAKSAESRAKQMGDELMQLLAQARAEAEAARTIVEYPAGRYECAKCRHSTIFTEPTRALPACENCGSREWGGHQPTVQTIEPPPPKKYPAGMYECPKCGMRTALAIDMDELSPCEVCGSTELKSFTA